MSMTTSLNNSNDEEKTTRGVSFVWRALHSPPGTVHLSHTTTTGKETLMSTSPHHHDDLIEFVIRNIDSSGPISRPFWHGIYDTLHGVTIDEDCGQAYAAGRTLIEQLIECEPVTSVSATMCHPFTVEKICSFFDR